MQNIAAKKTYLTILSILAIGSIGVLTNCSGTEVPPLPPPPEVSSSSDDISDISSSSNEIGESSSSGLPNLSSSSSYAASSSSGEDEESSSSIAPSSSSSNGVSSSSGDPSSSSNEISSSSSEISSSSNAPSSSSSIEPSSSSEEASSSSSAKCGNRTEAFDPDLYRCDGNKIYLKTPVSHGGENYEAVLIGSDTWMARNLNYNVDGSLCYDNTFATCDYYGKLYDWATAMALSPDCNNSNCTVDTKHKGICPSGWHIPNQTEWNALLQKGLQNLREDAWGDGSDIYGFDARPGGQYNPGDDINDGAFANLLQSGYWWSSVQNGNPGAYSYQFTASSYYNNGNNKSTFHSVRCVMD